MSDRRRVAADIAGERQRMDRGCSRRCGDAQRGARLRGERAERDRVLGWRERDVACEARELTRVGRADDIVVERAGTVGVEEAELVSVEREAVRVEATGLHPIDESVLRRYVERDVDRAPVSRRRRGQGACKHPAVDVGGRRVVGPNRHVPRRDRRELRCIEVVGPREVDVAERATVRVDTIAVRTVEDDRVNAGHRRGVVARDVAARVPAARHRLRARELQRPRSDLALGRDATRRALVRTLEAVRSRRDGRERLGVRIGDDAGIEHGDVRATDADGTRSEIDRLARSRVRLEQCAPADLRAARGAVEARAPFDVRATTPARRVGRACRRRRIQRSRSFRGRRRRRARQDRGEACERQRPAPNRPPRNQDPEATAPVSFRRGPCASSARAHRRARNSLPTPIYRHTGGLMQGPVVCCQCSPAAESFSPHRRRRTSDDGSRSGDRGRRPDRDDVGGRARVGGH